MHPSIRAFIAILLESDVQKELAGLQSEFKDLNLDVKWVKKSNLHLTLKFLGDISVEQIESVTLQLQKIAKRHSSFLMTFKDLGAFPSSSSPKILWAGIEEKTGTLAALNLAIEDELEKLEFPKEEKDFHPHITLGRIRSGKNITLLSKNLATHEGKKDLEQTVDAIALMKSTLTPQGPVYETLEKFQFSKEAV